MSPRTKVIHLVTLLELGGAQGNTIHTVRHLDPARFDARLWTGRGGFWDSDVESDLGKDGRLRFIHNLVRPVNPLRDVLAVLELWRGFRREKPDIVHTHSSKAGIVGRLAAVLAGVPVVIHTFHGFGFNDRQFILTRWLYVLLERWAARISDRLVFVSDSNRKLALQMGLGDPSRYVLVRSGVPLQKLAQAKGAINRDEIRRGLGIPPRAPIVVTVSAFKPQKNLADFIEVARLVTRDVADAHFVLVGDGEQRKALEALVARKELTGSVRMPGWVRDSAPLLAASDVFVLTSLWEGLPRALVESIAVGVPAICYRTDGVADLLTSDADVRPRGDIAGLASGVIRLLKDPAAAARQATTQASRITLDFDIGEMVRHQETLYSDIARLRVR